MHKQLAIIIGSALALPFAALADNPLKLQLADTLALDALTTWQGTWQDYDYAEKLDGVRAIWDGSKLLSRQGKVLNPPDWFIKAMPNYAVEGELWLGRARFAEVVGIINSNDGDWREIKFVLFELPYHTADSRSRYQVLQNLVKSKNLDFLQLATRHKVLSLAAIKQTLATIEKSGGEGLMLYRRAGSYHAGRSADLIKLKSYQDAEARVLAHIEGKGKYKGMLGALLVADAAGREFKIGTGFSDSERQNPPAVGALVNYRYNGLTKNAKPRFARFVREVTAP